MLKALALDALENGRNTGYSMHMTDPRSGSSLFTRITPRFVQSFADRYQIFSRSHTGKKDLAH